MKDKINEYGKGRHNALMEMILWIEKEIDKIKSLPTQTDTHVRSSLSGQIKAFSKIKTKIKTKIRNLKND